jgi:hypothetical protein
MRAKSKQPAALPATALNYNREQILKFGAASLDPWLAGEGFATDAEAESAWNAHRATLLAGHPAGARPWGWWRFERHQERPRGWWEEYQRLHDLEALHAGESERFELLHSELADREPAQSGDSRRYVMPVRDAPDPRRAAENQFVSQWHADRGRPEMARKYAARAAALKQLPRLPPLKGEAPAPEREPGMGEEVQ